MALTAQGKVIVWGKIGGPAGPRGIHGGPRGIQPGPMVAELMGLPPIVSIAAGQSHALLTDGERVWALGRSVHHFGQQHHILKVHLHRWVTLVVPVH